MRLWKKHKSELAGSLAYKGLFFLWFGPCNMAVNLIYGARMTNSRDPWFGPVSFAVGIVCVFLCQRIVRNAERTEIAASA
jgi:hypothetical protein